MNINDRRLYIYTAAKIYAARPEDGYLDAVRSAERLIEVIDNRLAQLELPPGEPGDISRLRELHNRLQQE